MEVIHSPSAVVHIPEGREETVIFKCRAKDMLGSADITFHAAAAGQESQLRSTLSIRPPVPLMTEVRGGSFTGDSADCLVTRHFLPQYRHLDAVLSVLPLGLAHGLDTYLHNYPDGCSEQLSSGALCRLLLADEADFGLTRQEVAEQLDNTFQILRHRQNDQGAFGYWGSESRPDIDFLTTYVMHFLIEAKDAGFDPPTDMFQAGLRFLQRTAAQTPENREEERTVAYAIYLLTREEVITTNYILNLRDYLDRTEHDSWKSDLTAVYLAGAYALLQKDDDAAALIRSYDLDTRWRESWFDFYTPLGMNSQYIAIIARHFPQLLDKVTPSDFHQITDPVEQGDFNTLSAAYAVLALKAYSHHLRINPPAMTISEQVGGGWRDLPATGPLLRRASFTSDASALRFSSEPALGGPGAYYQTISTGFESAMPREQIHDGLEIFREYRNAAGKVTDLITMGDALTVTLRIRSLNGKDITNVSIVDLLPGGFEIVNSSIQPGQHSAGCDYVDLREDRLLLYTTVTPTVKVIRYQIKPANCGQFTVPPVFAESMYDRGIKARGLGSTVRVVNPE